MFGSKSETTDFYVSVGFALAASLCMYRYRKKNIYSTPGNGHTPRLHIEIPQNECPSKHLRSPKSGPSIHMDDDDDELQKDILFTDVVPKKMEFTRQRKLTLDSQSLTEPVLVIGVCGGSGSGKTTLAKAIMENFGAEKVTYISHDYYYKDLGQLTLDQRAKHNFDHPDALETSLLVSHVKDLMLGECVDIPQYDFGTHSRLSERVPTLAKRVILIEGILIFADLELVNLMDIKIFVETPDDIRFIRRLKRDMQERDRAAESVIHQYMKFVRPMHMMFVEPSKRLADILVPQGVNAVALDMIISRLESFMNEKDLVYQFQVDEDAHENTC